MTLTEQERDERDEKLFSKTTTEKRKIHAALKADAVTNPFLSEEQKKLITTNQSQNPEWD